MPQQKRRNGAESPKFSPTRHAQEVPELLPPPSTVQELINLGDQAASALKNPSLRQALDHSIRALQAQWLESAPEEKAKRESLYLQSRSLVGAYEMLNGFIQQAQAEADRLRDSQGY